MGWKIILSVIFVTSNCEWIEIPQSTVPLEKPKKTDVSTLFLTTTSTTAQTPVIIKPLTITTIKPKVFDKPNRESTTNITDNVTDTKRLSLNSTSNSKMNHLTGNVSPKHDNIEIEVDDSNEYIYQNNTNTETYDDSSEAEENDYSYSSFIPYLSEIQSILMKNSRKNKKSKISVLANLRDHLLYEIQNRITSTWGAKTTGRSAREHKDDHVDFPSNEGALLTIGFLTFAVFLIKLVLQLIQSIGNNNNNNNNGNTTFVGRKRREVINDASARILSYIDEFQYK